MQKIYLVRVWPALRMPTPVFVARAINDTVARENVLERMQADPNENKRSWARNLTEDNLKATEILSPTEDMREISEADLR
jgi:hypothetical protein